MRGPADSARTSVEADPLRKALKHSLAFWAVAAPVWVMRGRRDPASIRARLPPRVPSRGARGPARSLPLQRHRLAGAAAGDGLPLPAARPHTCSPRSPCSPCSPARYSPSCSSRPRCRRRCWCWVSATGAVRDRLPLVADDHRHPDRERHAAARARARADLALPGQGRAVAALATGLVIAVKLVFWPMLVWLVATRRYRTAALRCGCVGRPDPRALGGHRVCRPGGYSQMLSSVSGREGPRSYSMAALLHWSSRAGPRQPRWRRCRRRRPCSRARCRSARARPRRDGAHRPRDPRALAARGDPLPRAAPRGGRALPPPARCRVAGSAPHLGSICKRTPAGWLSRTCTSSQSSPSPSSWR